jgi:1-acyl-sn-glycerol-3-phosphate acyltransferase
MKPLYLFGWTISWIAARLIFRMKIYQKENLPHTGAYILASNHISLADPQFVGSAVSREMHFLAKKELFKNRFFGNILRRVNAHPLNRAGFDKKALETAVRVLQSGEPMIIFPEGTRGRDGNFLPVRPGIGKIARTAKVPVVPAYVTGTDKLSACFSGRKKPGLIIGHPITVEEIGDYNDDKQGFRELAEEIMDRIKNLKDKLDRRVN